jgi:MFS family permease
MYTILSAFAEMWGTPYLMVAYEINNETASYGSMLVFIGMAMGCLASPLLANHWRSHRKVMSIGALGALAMFLPAVYLNDLPLYSVFALLFFAGFFCGWQILNFAAAKEINPPEFSGTTMGFMNALTMASAPIFQMLLGRLIDLFEDGEVGLDGVKLYSPEAYQYALFAIPVSLLFAWVILRFVRETHPDRASK